MEMSVFKKNPFEYSCHQTVIKCLWRRVLELFESQDLRNIIDNSLTFAILNLCVKICNVKTESSLFHIISIKLGTKVDLCKLTKKNR